MDNGLADTIIAYTKYTFSMRHLGLYSKEFYVKVQTDPCAPAFTAACFTVGEKAGNDPNAHQTAEWMDKTECIIYR